METIINYMVNIIYNNNNNNNIHNNNNNHIHNSMCMNVCMDINKI